ncbi:MAG: hypothetical protein QW076_04340, partial [Candidatus Anstonellales archaeon]
MKIMNMFIVILIIFYYYSIPLFIYGNSYDLDEMGHIGGINYLIYSVEERTAPLIQDRPSYYFYLTILNVIMDSVDLMHFVINITLLFLIIITSIIIFNKYSNIYCVKIKREYLFMLVTLLILSNFISNYHALPYVYAFAEFLLIYAIYIVPYKSGSEGTFVVTYLLIYIAITFSNIFYAFFLFSFMIIMKIMPIFGLRKSYCNFYSNYSIGISLIIIMV